MDACGFRAGKRGERVRPKDAVRPRQRVVEVGRDDVDVAGEVLRQSQDFVTKATRSASCWAVSELPNVVGMMFWKPGGTYDGGGLVMAIRAKSESESPAFLA
jgi:hypothetical protein